MERKRRKKVCVFGSYKDLGKEEKEKATGLGRLLAEKGFEVVSGGFGGTMEDISRGAKEKDGRTIGVTYYKHKDISGKRPNRYIDEEIRAENIFERIDIMLKNSDAFIVLPGGTGTLFELAACLEHMNKGIMKPKPLIALGNFWKKVVEILVEEPLLSEEARNALGGISCAGLVTFVNTPEEAVAKIIALLQPI